MLENIAAKATVAKIRSKHGKMLSTQNYKELMNSRSIAEIAEFLKKTERYKDVLVDVETATIHRGYLEELLRRSVYDIYLELCKFQRLDSNDFYKFLIKKLEVEQILDCVMHFNSPETDFINSTPSYLFKKLSFNLTDLAHSKNFDEVVQVLKKTRYAEILKDVEINTDGSTDYFKLEILLRTDYYNQMFDVIKKSFRGRDADTLTKIFKRKIEVENIINAYRMKVFFNADDKMIKTHSLPFYGQFNKEKMNRIYEMSTIDDMINEFKKIVYAKSFHEFDQDSLEPTMKKVWHQTLKSSLCGAQTAPVALYTFICLCEIEVQNLITIIEAKRYDVMPTDIEKMLII